MRWGAVYCVDIFTVWNLVMSSGINVVLEIVNANVYVP